jgi:hypothetical protein
MLISACMTDLVGEIVSDNVFSGFLGVASTLAEEGCKQ